MNSTDWNEILHYSAWTTVLVLLAILLTGALAHWCIESRLRKRLPALYVEPFRGYGRGWWARLKAWWRRK